MVRLKTLASLLMLPALLAGTTALAQTATTAHKDTDLSLEEVVVTGTKRSVAQQDLSIAVTTVSAKQLDNSFQNDVTALAQMAPNVTLTPQVGFNAIGGGMRGTGFISILVTKDPSVGISVDEFAFNHVQSQFVEMFDIDQVEIYRGPQGTLFGKNTTGGAIAFTTKKPVLGKLFGNAEVDYGQFSSNNSTFSKVKLALNVPMGETLAARLAVIQDKSQGFYTNNKPPGGTFTSFGCPAGPGYDACIASVISKFPLTGDGSKIGGTDVLAAKLKFRWEPNDAYLADLTFEYAKDRGDSQVSANETPNGEGYAWPLIGFPGIGNGDPFSTGQSYTANAVINIPAGHRVDARGIYLTQAYKAGQFELKSITGVRRQDEILASDYTGEAYTSLYDASRNSQRKQFQQELRLTSQFKGPFNFTSGAVYFKDDVNFVVFGSLGFFLPLAGPAGEFYRDRFEVQNTVQKRDNWAVYADGSYKLTDKATLTAGFRHTEDKKDFHRLSLGTLANAVSNFIDATQYRGPFTNPLPESAFGNNIRANKSFSANTYRVVLDYHWTPKLMTYASYATGFVSGGFSETCGSVTSCAPYKSETNDNLELGIKADTLGGKLRMNAALFQTKYKNLQRDTVVPFTDAAGNQFQETRSVNEGKSTANGLELEATYVPLTKLRFDAFLGLLDHKYDSYNPFADPVPLGLPAGPPRRFDFSALDVTFSPKVTAGATVTYIQGLTSGGSLTYNVSAHYMSEFETNPFPANFQGPTVPGGDIPIVIPKANTQGQARTLLNAYLTWKNDSENFDVTLYGKNLSDEVYRVAANPVATLWNFSRHGPPRELGLQVGYKF